MIPALLHLLLLLLLFLLVLCMNIYYFTIAYKSDSAVIALELCGIYYSPLAFVRQLQIGIE